jgi:hypothetical protein
MLIFSTLWSTEIRAARPDRKECLYLKPDSAMMVMKRAADGRRYDAARVLDGARDRSVLGERR